MPNTSISGEAAGDHQPEMGRDDGPTRRHIEDLLDHALEETFPASDPPSIAMPNDGWMAG